MIRRPSVSEYHAQPDNDSDTLSIRQLVQAIISGKYKFNNEWDVLMGQVTLMPQTTSTRPNVLLNFIIF